MTNSLASARSPYLRAHADNPVDWQMWEDAVLARARREGKPLFVSVGYSACHWCHVMAREAFSDPAVAHLLNTHFVSIKVDREERPDIDRVLQAAHEALTGRGGGWPLSVFMDSETLAPFYAGTYFPLVPRYGVPAFPDLLERIAALWQERHDDLVRQSRQLQDWLSTQLGESKASGGMPAPDLPARLQTELARGFDTAYKGLGSGPKFPQCPTLAFLLEQGDGDLSVPTLQAMATGGLRDHVGGGFFRYTVDREWRVPHFEKMLADNVQLMALYAEAAVRHGSKLFRQVALETAAFLEAEMRLADGGYATSLNAEAGGVEGGFYLWTPESVRACVAPERFDTLAAAFGLDGEPQVDGAWHLARRDDGTADFSAQLQRLHAARATRVRPERDDKCLTRLNAMAVTALMRTGWLLGEPALRQRGVALFRQLVSWAVAGDDVWACRMEGEFYQPAFLADHAALAEAALAVASTGDDGHVVGLACQLAGRLLDRFRTATGRFVMTEVAETVVMYRPGDDGDDALPAGAAMATRVLIALGHLLAEPRWLDAAEAALRHVGPDLERHPQMSPTWAGTYRRWREPEWQVVMRGGARLDDWTAAVLREHPEARVIRLSPQAVPLPALERFAMQGNGVAYACHGTTCSLPVTNVDDLQQMVAR